MPGRRQSMPTFVPKMLSAQHPSATGLASRATGRRTSVFTPHTTSPALLPGSEESSPQMLRAGEAATAETLHEQLVAQMRRSAVVYLASALCLTLPATLLVWLCAVGYSPPLVHGLASVVGALLLASLAAQLHVGYRQLRATDPDRLLEQLQAIPPELIPVDTTQPPLLQAIDVLTKLRDHFLTDGNPCSPRLLIHPLDASGNPVDEQTDASHAAFRSRSRALIREPLGYTKAKIRQAAKDPRALRWEEQLSLEQHSRDENASPTEFVEPSMREMRRASTIRQGDRDVHGFITANYGSALRYTEEAATSARGGRFNKRASSGGNLLAQAAHGLAMPLEPNAFAEAQRLLQVATARGEAGWGFDAIALGQATGDHGLVFLGYHLFKHFGLISHFEIEHEALLSLLRRIESAYRKNPYHCRDHGCDVAQAAMWLLNAGGSDDESAAPAAISQMYRNFSDSALADGTRGSSPPSERRRSIPIGGGPSASAEGEPSEHMDAALISLMEPTDVLALIIASLAHDMDHTGQNNAFHVATSSELAIVYNDKSVLENHHCATLFAAMKECDIFGALSTAQKREVRDLMISMILSTDMAVHFKNVDRLSAALSAGDLDLSKRDDKSFVLEMLIHSADVSNPCRQERVYRLWTDKVMAEFYNQGDLEKRGGLPVSKFFDRDNPNVPKCQVGFINFVVQPLINVVAELIDIQPLVQNLRSNLGLMQEEEREATLKAEGHAQ